MTDPAPGSRFCPHCSRPLPVSLLDPALYLAGDPGLDAPSREFVQNMRSLLLLGCDLSPGHRERLLGLFADRHGRNAESYLDRRARMAVDV